MNNGYGQLLPAAPPLGSVFVAWSDDRTVQQWLDRNPDARAAADTYLRRLAQVRARGYIVEFHTPASFLREMKELDHSPSMREAIARLLEEGGAQSEMMLTRSEPVSRYRVGSMHARVRSRRPHLIGARHRRLFEPVEWSGDRAHRTARARRSRPHHRGDRRPAAASGG